MRAARMLGYAVAALLALLVLGLLAVKLFVNPNDFKPRIVAAVRQATGRELSLPGDLKLGVFPWVSVEFGPAALGNPAGFPATPFMAVKRVALRVRLLPLLRKELQIGRIEIEGLDLRLQKNPAGKGNWEDLGGKEQPPASPPAGSGSGSESLRDLGGVLVKDSRFSYQDLVAEDVSLEIGRFASGTTTPVNVKLRLTSSPGAPPVDVSASFALSADLGAKRFELGKLEFAGTRAAQAGTPALTVNFSAPEFKLDLRGQSLSAPEFELQLDEARVTGSLSGTGIADVPHVSGRFRLAEVSPRVLMAKLGRELPPTRDPQALSRVSASGSFAYGGNAAQADPLEVHLDDSTLRGRVAVTDLRTDALGFSLALDQIDFDRYRSPAPPPGQKARAPESPQAASNSAPSGLKSLLLDGTLSVGSVTVAGLHATQFSATVVSKDAVLRLAPVKAQFYGGSYAGEITVDSRSPVPALTIDQSMSNVDVAPLLRDFAKSNRLSGRGNVTTRLTARGLGGEEVLGSLNGQATAALNNGALEGLDLWFEINRAMSVIQKQGLPSGSSSGRTRFDEFRASADIANGVATTRDLSIVSRNLRVAGAGTVNLPTEALDCRVTATVLRQAGPVTAANTLAVVPVTISGSMANPKVTPDLEGIAKARLQQELDKHKGELQQKIQDQLRSIFK